MLIPLKYTIRIKDNLSPYMVIVIGWRSKNLCLTPSKMFMILWELTVTTCQLKLDIETFLEKCDSSEIILKKKH